MRIVVLCDGKTEQVLRPALRGLLHRRTSSTRVGIDTKTLGGSVARSKLPRILALEARRQDVIAVVGLTDVYPDFRSADEAKNSLRQLAAASPGVVKFRAHVAKFEVEAWLMPFWAEIAAGLKVQAKPPRGRPEEINDQDPPSKHLEALYRRAGTAYQKPRDAAKWLTPDRLEIAAKQCPELKSFLNSLLELAGAELLP